MAQIRAFKGLRPQDNLCKKVASLPYDVMNSDEARELVKDNDISFLHIVKPEVDLNKDINLYSDEVYNKAKSNLEKMIADKIFEFDSEEAIYIYSQKMGDHIQTGLLALMSVDEYDNNVIKKHEKTRKDKEDDRSKHVVTLGANTGPVFLAYREENSIDAIIAEYTKKKADVDFVAEDSIQHTLWKISDQTIINQLIGEFDSVPALYVADGHHRSKSASRAREYYQDKNKEHNGTENYNYFLGVLFPGNQLKILAYNRAVMDLNGLNKDEFLTKIEDSFIVEKTTIKEPKGSLQFSMYLDGSWYLLKAKEGTFNPKDPIDSLDVSILQNNLLNPLLGVGDPRTSKKISFIGGIRGTEELERVVNNGDFKVSFSMFPTTVDQLMNIADADGIMPPKSTWFEPKLRSGMVVHKF